MTRNCEYNSRSARNCGDGYEFSGAAGYAVAKIHLALTISYEFQSSMRYKRLMVESARLRLHPPSLATRRCAVVAEVRAPYILKKEERLGRVASREQKATCESSTSGGFRGGQKLARWGKLSWFPKRRRALVRQKRCEALTETLLRGKCG